MICEMDKIIKQRVEQIRKPAICPSCGSDRIARIQYGMPNLSAKLSQELLEGEVVLGGCCISDDDPSWQCMACRLSIFKSKDL